MKKTKVLGPSNDDDVPADEMLLAQLVQNAKSRGMGVVWGPGFVNYDGDPGVWYVENVPDFDGSCCCAAGAAELEEDTRHCTGGLVSGHEDRKYEPCSHYSGVELIGYAAGAAFGAAMGGRKRSFQATEAYDNLKIQI